MAKSSVLILILALAVTACADPLPPTAKSPAIATSPAPLSRREFCETYARGMTTNERLVDIYRKEFLEYLGHWSAAQKAGAKSRAEFWKGRSQYAEQRWNLQKESTYEISDAAKKNGCFIKFNGTTKNFVLAEDL
jgi:hypothetical protein